LQSRSGTTRAACCPSRHSSISTGISFLTSKNREDCRPVSLSRALLGFFPGCSSTGWWWRMAPYIYDRLPQASPETANAEEKAVVAALPAVIWRDPGPPSTLNLLYGVGGEHAPDPNGQYTFLKEDMNGTSPKFDVKDEYGVRWWVKLGQEPQSETAATRLLCAAGAPGAIRPRKSMAWQRRWRRESRS